MSDTRVSRPQATVALVLAVCLVGVNMRPTITALGPLIPQISADTGMTPATLGILAALPLVMWGVFSPIASAVSRRFGLATTMLMSLIVLALGTLLRSVPGPLVNLWLGTAIIGFALAIVNVLMPAVVKREFAGRVALMTGIYTSLLAGSGAFASGLAVPATNLTLGGGGWRVSLLVIGGAALPVAILWWWWATRGRDRAEGPPPARTVGRTAIWRDRIAWLVAGYMGVQASVFYMLVTWMATFSTSVGNSAVVAGIHVMVYQLFSLVGSVALPLALRISPERWVPAAVPIVGLAGTAGLMAAPELIPLWAAILGVSSGASLSMAMTLIAQRARDHGTAAALSGMSQSVGYLIAGFGPIAFGGLHTATAGWFAPLALLAGVLIAQLLIGYFVGRERYVLEPAAQT